jgi:hypothetical protein
LSVLLSRRSRPFAGQNLSWFSAFLVVSLFISSLKAFACIGVRRFAPATPFLTSFSLESPIALKTLEGKPVADHRNGTPMHVHQNEDEHFIILEGDGAPRVWGQNGVRPSRHKHYWFMCHNPSDVDGENQTVGAEVRPTDRQSRGSEGLCAAKMGLTKLRAQIFGLLTRALALAFLGRVPTLRDTFLAKNPGRGL